MHRILPFLLLAACSGPDETDTPDVQVPPSFPPEQPDPWVVEGQVGDLTLIRQEATVTSGRVLRVAAMFADRLDGLRWPAACEFADRLCVPEDAPLETVIESSDLGLTPEDRAYSWLGDTLQLGDVSATFDVKKDGETAGYRGRQLAEGLLLSSYPLAFQGGEWGDFEAGDVAPLPDDITILSPPPEEPIELDGDRLAELRWIPTGQGQMVLSINGPGGSQTRLLEDDGRVLIDTDGYRFTRPLDVRLSRVSDAGIVAIGGNTLSVHTVAEQGFCLYDTCDGEPIGGVPDALVFEFCWSSNSCGDSQWILDPDGSWSTAEGYIGNWSYDCCSETIDIFFSSGTHYFGTRDEDGCYVGEMISWSGNQGDWRGCF